MMQDTQIVLPFARLCGKTLHADFDGGTLTSDGGVLFLRETEAHVGVIRRLGEALDDRRDGRYTAHSYEAMLRQLRRVHHHKAHRGQCHVAIARGDVDLALHTAPIPLSGGVLTALARFSEQQWQRRLRLPPRFELLTDRTGPGHSGEQAHLMLQAQPQGSLVIGLTIGHDPLELSSAQSHLPTDCIKIGRTQRVEHLPQACLMHRDPLKPRLQQGQHPPLRKTLAHFVQGMMAIENGQDQRFHTASSRHHGG